MDHPNFGVLTDFGLKLALNCIGNRLKAHHRVEEM
jgi:hypothetical protein